MHIVLQEQRGIAEARELGFRAARGEIIASTDADTIPPREWLQLLVRAFEGNPDLVGIYGPIRLYGGNCRHDPVSRINISATDACLMRHPLPLKERIQSRCHGWKCIRKSREPPALPRDDHL